MRLTSSTRAIRSILAIAAMFSVGGGCIALYGFEDFEKKPPISCTEASNCPGNDVCSTRVCEQGVCKRINPQPADVTPAAQEFGDCKLITCDGKGGEIVEEDPTDLPFDGNECTDDYCGNAIPSNPPRIGEDCGTTNPPLKCNDAGFCAGCSSAADCGFDSLCSFFACENGICTRTPQNTGAVVNDPVVGDCKATVCTPTGNAKEGFAPTDAIQDDNKCTVETCLADGSVVSTPSMDGLSCGDCLTCSAGTCTPCSPSTSDCYGGECIPKPQACTTAADCPTGYCVDDYCCESECGAPCEACSNALTGVPSGKCAPVLDNSDPDDDCNTPLSDVCQSGSCKCGNGIRDPDESNIDCGGSCNVCVGAWSCGGLKVCDGATTNGLCCELFPGGCGNCTNMSNKCKSYEGQPCAPNSEAVYISLGVTSDSDCAFGQTCKYAICQCVQ
jgi:hypothetical protein